MDNNPIWLTAVREQMAQVIKQADGVPQYEAMAVCGLFLDDLKSPLSEWVATTDGSEASVASLEAMLAEAQSALEVELLQRKGVGEVAIERFRGHVVQAISAVMYQTGMASA